MAQDDPNAVTYRAVELPNWLWDALDRYRQDEGLSSLEEAFRRLVEAGLAADPPAAGRSQREP